MCRSGSCRCAHAEQRAHLLEVVALLEHLGRDAVSEVMGLELRIPHQAIDVIAAHYEGWSWACSNTIRTARSRTSGEK